MLALLNALRAAFPPKVISGYDRTRMEKGHVEWAEMQGAQVEQMGLENYLANQTGGAGAGLAEVLTIRSIARRSLIRLIIRSIARRSFIMLMTGRVPSRLLVRVRECATSRRDAK